ncbi:MAG: hypothetical protein KAW17_01885 [Candidatus Eisenbacteria sp.]|nr:hypothetical protein [Candidatus Eisenbacteria bacterium]
MLRYVLASALVLLMAAPAGATVYETNGTTPDDITITLTIGCYTNVYWNNTDADHNIVFNDIVQDMSNTGDWYSSILRAGYGSATKSSQDPYATGYYESYDGAFFWLESNCDVQWDVTPDGNLTSNTDQLPTWYTIAFTNNKDTGLDGNIGGGFIDGDARWSCGTIPLDGGGTYAQDANSDGSMTLFQCYDDFGTPGDQSAFYPNQWPFPMTEGMKRGNYHASCQGTVEFKARVERSGLADDSGVYTAHINMVFTESTP